MALSDQDFRRDKRVTFATRSPLATVSGDGGMIENATTIDLSESGAKVRLSGQIQPGQVVDLFLSKRPEQCRVVWTAPGEETEELIAGLEFMCPLPDVRRRQTPPSSRFEPIN
jgi:hypothetical protein